MNILHQILYVIQVIGSVITVFAAQAQAQAQAAAGDDAKEKKRKSILLIASLDLRSQEAIKVEPIESNEMREERSEERKTLAAHHEEGEEQGKV